MEGDTTQLLMAMREGDRGALGLLFARVYGELRVAARRRLRAHGSEATLNTTGLVHEAYLRLVDPEVVGPEDRDHFLSRDPLFVSLHPDPRFQRLVEGNRAEMARQRAGVLEAMREG